MAYPEIKPRKELPQKATKDELADMYGLSNYDMALPQDWLDMNSERLAGYLNIPKDDAYHMIRSGTVWCYDHYAMGSPFYLYRELYNHMHASVTWRE